MCVCFYVCCSVQRGAGQTENKVVWSSRAAAASRGRTLIGILPPASCREGPSDKHADTTRMTAAEGRGGTERADKRGEKWRGSKGIDQRREKEQERERESGGIRVSVRGMGERWGDRGGQVKGKTERNEA